MRSGSTPALVSSLEEQLANSLRPVQPRTEFVSHLHTRLTNPSSMMLERRHSMGLSLLLIALSLTSGLVVLLVFRFFRRGV